MPDQDRIQRIEVRLEKVERFQQDQRTARAVDEEKRKHLDAKFDEVNNRLGKIDGHISKLVWLIIGLIVSGIMGVLFKGVPL